MDGGKCVGKEWFDRKLCTKEEICKRIEGDGSMFDGWKVV